MSGIVDRKRYGVLAGVIAETLGRDPDAVDLVTEQIVRTIQADPALGQSGAVVRIAQALEGIGSSLHVLQGLYALDVTSRGVVDIDTIEKLATQAMAAYARNEQADKAKDPSDLPPGVLG